MALCLALGLLACTGCQVVLLAGAAAAGAGAAIWHGGKLVQTVEAPLQVTYEAALDALEEDGLPIIEQRADSVTAHIESEYADDKHVWIDMEAVGDTHTEVKVRVGLVGDKDRSLRILDGIKERL
jgi:hypothetical protein